MNWYNLLKFAQIWEVASDGWFIDEVKRMYELEYKLSMIERNMSEGNQLSFNKRMQNVVEKVEEELADALNNVKQPLVNVFFNWLESHALTDPKKWADKFMDPEGYADWDEYMHATGGEPVEALHSAIDIYKRMQNDNRPWHNMNFSNQWAGPNWDAAFKDIINEIGADNILSLKELTEELLLPDRKEIMYDELSNMGLEEFNETYGQQFQTPEEAQNYINNLTAENIGIDTSDIFELYELESLANIANEHGYLYGILHELYQKAVFPQWFNYWESQGIVETRENVERVYGILTSAKNIKDQIVAINLAINTAHQNGSMLEYLGQYGGDEEEIGDTYNIQEELAALTKGDYVEEWNIQLREIGVKV